MNFQKKTLYIILFANFWSLTRAHDTAPHIIFLKAAFDKLIDFSLSDQKNIIVTSDSTQEKKAESTPSDEQNNVNVPDSNANEALKKATVSGNIVESRSNGQGAIRNNKKWTVMVYIAADNDLRGFAARNIKQMAAVGSNERVNILVHLDIKITGNKKITRRYYIESGRINHMNDNDPSTARMDSGNPETLISFVDWSVRNYPAEKYCLILWNHGTGPIDPGQGKIVNPSNLFTLNPVTNKWELDRSVGFLEYVCNSNTKNRGIAWDDTTGNYLTNQTMEHALKTIKETILSGQKLALIGFDACLMSTIEIANIVKNYAHYCVASQEVEMGTGWKYNDVLAPFLTQDMDEESFAAHIVRAYEKTYEKINDDFTLSAVNLKLVDHLEHAIDNLSQSLLHALTMQRNLSVARWIRNSKNTATRFDEPSYIDLHHLLHNLANQVNTVEFLSGHDKHGSINDINQHINACLHLIEQTIIENTVGPNVSRARGISIYFPDKKVHPSYKKCNFALQNNWHNLISALTKA